MKKIKKIKIRVNGKIKTLQSRTNLTKLIKKFKNTNKKSSNRSKSRNNKQKTIVK